MGTRHCIHPEQSLVSCPIVLIVMVTINFLARDSHMFTCEEEAAVALPLQWLVCYNCLNWLELAWLELLCNIYSFTPLIWLGSHDDHLLLAFSTLN
jgi:hypothetical protein